MLLTDEGKKEFLKNRFHQYFDITIEHDGALLLDKIDFANFVLPLSKIGEDYDLDSIKKFLNNDYNNVIFTSGNEQETIYRYEVYQGVYFIRLEPFYYKLRMHIIPKKYDASNTKSNNPLLFFKDNLQTIDENNFTCTADKYERKTDKNNINLYYKKPSKQTSNGFYKFDIRGHTRDLTNLQINLGYSYNDTNPTDEINHWTGVLDESDENGNPIEDFTEWNITLIDSNCDNVSVPNDPHFDLTNWAQTQKLSNGKLIWPEETNMYKGTAFSFFNNHTINTLYHKTIKYFNDDLYVEEVGDGRFALFPWDEDNIRGN